MSTSAAYASLAPARSRESPRAIAAWLLACCALVFAMVVVGGVTRLTHSGLSIVEWQPIVGTLPPLDEAQWQETFAKYRRRPSTGWSTTAWRSTSSSGSSGGSTVHRLLGRLIGVVFLLPFLVFLVRRRIPPGYG